VSAAALVALVLAFLPPGPAMAQEWNSAAARSLAERATELRLHAQADTGLRSYRTTAHGLVFLLAQVGAGLTEPPRLVKADQLDVEVYWQAPGVSKQQILAWRDGRFLPTDVVYHRDHLGIVTGNFGPRIRIGEGDEVRDVVHPLSPAGLDQYDFALGDTVSLQSGDRRIRLVAVRVRPRFFERPLVVGTLYLDTDTDQLVRFQFGFTPSAYLDPSLEFITVSLENALYEDRYWLPYHQDIEIGRRAAWLDLPARTIIRGSWQVGEYTFNLPVPDSILRGPTIGGPLTPADSGYQWQGSLQDAIGEAAPPVNRQDLEAVRSEVQRIAAHRALDGLPRQRLGANAVSDLVHVNRVEGLAVGLGARLGFGTVVLRPRLGYGFSSHLVTGGLEVTDRWGPATAQIFGGREVRDLSDFPVISLLLNSMTAQEAGNDHGDWVLLTSGGGRLRWGIRTRGSVEVEVRAEHSQSLAVAATPFRGEYRPNPPLGAGTYGIAGLRLERAAAGVAADRDLHGAIRFEIGAGPAGYARVAAEGAWLAPLGPGHLLTRAAGGVGSASLPAYRNFVLGGRGTLLGEPYRAYGGARSAWVSTEWRFPVPFPAIGLGPYASTGNTLILAPLVQLGWADRPAAGMPWTASEGIRPVVGLATEWLMQLIRVEAGVALRGGGFGVTVDVNRSWWGIL
jgi:hypothetical protein